MLNIKNVSLKNNLNVGTVQVQVETHHIQLIKSMKDDKSDKDFVKIKFRGDPSLEKSDLYEFKMALFYNRDPEEFLLFILNFNKNIEASITLKAGANIQHLRTLVRGEQLNQCDVLSAEVESASP